MKRNLMKTLSLVLSLAMLFALAACTQEEAPPEAPTAPPTEEATRDDTPEAPPEPKTLVVGYTQFSQKFSSFFASTAYDQDVASMTQVPLLLTDRVGNIIFNAIEGETNNYNGTDHEYKGVANWDVVQKPDGSVDYNITIRDDLVYSDGAPMTIDDVIFSMYVYSDTDYDGSAVFSSSPIRGMGSYRSGVSQDIFDKYEELGWAIFEAGIDNTKFDDWTEALQNEFWTTYFDKGGAAFAQDIVNLCVAEYSAYLGEVWGDSVALGMYAWGFGWPGDPDDGEDENIFYTAVLGNEFDIAGGNAPTVEDFWAEIFEAYGMDFSESGINYEAANYSIEELMVQTFISGEGPKDPDAGGEIMNIEGIKRTGDYSVTVTTDTFDATVIYQLGIEVTPLHYYGDPDQYDYANNKFGFPKGDLSIVRTKTTMPMGAGAYKFLSYESGVVSFEANANYYKGEPKIKYIRFQEAPDADKLAGIVSGSFDITDPSFSTTTVESIKEYNSNGELTGDVVATSTVDNLGYGYIGIAANNVNIGGERDSDASKYLRTAIATVLAVYRNTVNNSYYGDRASTIEYPISNTSWAAPRPNDEGYRIAYSRDVDGNDIYTASMSEAEREAAALDAALGFLKAAGYTVDEEEGVVTAAPKGGSLVFDALIGGDGVGDHPAYGVFTAGKEGLAKIGITLEISDLEWDPLQAIMQAGEAQLWAAAWGATIDPDMHQIYHSSNVMGAGGTGSNTYFITDDELDDLIMEARTSADQTFRKVTYMRALEVIMEWAVELPNYQRQNAFIFSPERVNMDTVTPDITTFWTWMNDLELLEVN